MFPPVPNSKEMIDSKISSLFIIEHSKKVRKFPRPRNEEEAENSESTVAVWEGLGGRWSGV